MIHHPGEVIEVLRPTDSDIKSADKDTLATLRMWDENIMTLVVDPKIASKIKAGDKVLVDYRPTGLPEGAEKPLAMAQRQRVTKILGSKRGEKIWMEYREFFMRMKKPVTQPQQQYHQKQPQSYIG